MEVSQLKYYSRGIVSEEKADLASQILVIPIEFRFMSGGKVKVNEEETTTTYGKMGGEDVVVARTTDSIPARWFKRNSNRITPPDVMPGDEVIILRMGDTDIYYWEDLNIANVKRLEEVTIAFAADPKNKMKDDLSNAYYLTYSSKNKHITLQTSKANGEPFAYTVQINTEDGNMTSGDDVGNITWLDSANTVIGMENANGTLFKIDKNNMVGYAPDSMLFTADKMVHFKTDKYILECNTFLTEATQSAVIKSPKITLDGEVETTKSLKVAKDVKAGGSGKFGGSGSFGGKLSHGGPPCC